MGHRPAIAVALLCASGLLEPTVSARPGKVDLRLSGPARAVGDGAAAIEVRLQVSPSEGVATITNLELSADAGTLGEARPDGSDAIIYPFVPPRVATDRKVVITATARLGRRAATARHELIVTPPSITIAAATSGGAYDLRAPAYALLGHPGPIEITLSKSPGAPPTLHASAGRLSALRDTGNGRLTASYQPPVASYPHVAIIAAVADDGSAFDWLALPLHAAAKLRLASEAQAQVVVTLGGVAYGPVRTNRRGAADLVVVVPPGVDRAETLATDALGNDRSAYLDLHPPAFARLLAICPRATGRALLFAIDSSGAPLQHAKLAPQVAPGTLAAPESVGPGVYALPYRAPEGSPIGAELTLETSLADTPGSHSSCRSTVPGEAPSALQLEVTAAQYRAGTAVPIQVTVHPQYSGRLPPLVVPISATADLGSVVLSDRQPDGTWLATWTLADSFQGRDSATLSVRATNGLTSTSTIALTPGPPAKLRAGTRSSSVRSNGRDHTTLEITATDAHDNPIAGASLQLTSAGDIGAVKDHGDGRYTASYRAGVAYAGRTDHVRIAATTGAHTSVTIAWRPMRHRFAMSARLGYMSNGHKVAGPTAALAGTYRLPLLGDAFSLGVEASITHSSSHEVASDRSEQVDTSVTSIPLLARATVAVPLAPVTLYAGGGAGLVYSHTEATSTSTGRVVANGAVVGLVALLGGDIPLGVGRAVLELTYLRARIDHDAVRGNAGGLFATAGYSLEF